MKKAILTVFVLVGGGAAYAQSNVSLYGVVDLGLWHQSRAPAAVPNLNAGSLTSLNTGGLSPSVFGLRGEEAVSSDLKVTFNLESHLDPSRGATGLDVFWARAANVGLAGSWGSVKLGRQLVPAVLGYMATDPRGMRESLSGTQPWAYSSLQNLGAGTATPNSVLAFFASNSVSYEKTFDGFYFGVLYALGEVAGSGKNNRVISLGISYTGSVIVSGAFHESKWATTGENSERKASIGVGLPIGPVVLKANYLSTKAYDNTGAALGDWRVWGIGGEYAIGGNHTLTAAYYRGKNEVAGLEQDKAHTIVVSDEYSLSKRTTLYMQLGAIKTGDQAGIVVSLLGSQPVQGARTYVFNAGIRHRF